MLVRMTTARMTRWAIAIGAVVLGGALVVTAWSSHARARAIAGAVARGQAEILLDGLRAELARDGGPPTAARLEELLDAYRERGLRYVAAPLREGLVEAGEPVGARAPAGPPRPGEPLLRIERVGGRVRATAFPPPRPPGGPRPPPGALVPPLVLELEPVLADALLASARRALAIAGAVAALVVLAALIAFRLLRARELMEAQHARERHLATLGEMSAVLAHEIRNPLASLKGHAQLLEEALDEPGPRRDKAALVVREAVRLEDLVTGLLAFIRTGAIDRRDAEPAAVLRAAVAAVGGGVEIDDTRAPARWSMDPDRMQQVLENLVRNAVQAGPPVTARVVEDRGALVYEVRDRGPGITDGAAIFQPFHTGKIHGTGLGLAVAKRVVELHGGAIRADNHPDGGARFRVSIPA